PFGTGRALAGVGSAEAVVLAQGFLRGAVLRRLALGVAVVLSLALAGGATLLGLRHEGEAREARGRPSGEAEVRPGAAARQGDPLPPGAVARLGTMRFHHLGATFVAFPLDGKRLLSAGDDGAARLWDVATGQEVRRLALAREGAAGGVTVSVSAD